VKSSARTQHHYCFRYLHWSGSPVNSHFPFLMNRTIMERLASSFSFPILNAWVWGDVSFQSWSPQSTNYSSCLQHEVMCFLTLNSFLFPFLNELHDMDFFLSQSTTYSFCLQLGVICFLQMNSYFSFLMNCMSTEWFFFSNFVDHKAPSILHVCSMEWFIFFKLKFFSNNT
jgi:hypothetical protein